MTIPESPTPAPIPPLNPPPGKNRTTWIIVAVVAVVLVLCALLVVAVVGGLFFIRSRGAAPNLPQGLPFFSTPNPNSTPQSANGPLVVESFDPTNSTFPALPDLIPGWKGLTQPGIQNWKVTVPSKQGVVILLGWCTSTTQILDQNYQSIKWGLTVDGKSVDVSKLFPLDQQIPNEVCRSYSGIIRQWPGRLHTITTTMSVAQKINDGFSDYPAGDYTDVYNVTVR